MIDYEKYPIYKTSTEILKLVSEKTKNFQNDYRHSLGNKMFSDSLNLSYEVCNAITKKDKSSHIENMIELLELLRLTIRLSFDLKLINKDAMTSFSELTDSAMKQTIGWKKSLNIN